MPFYTCGPNEALVLSGLCHAHPKLVPGGRVFKWPFVQKLQRYLRLLSLPFHADSVARISLNLLTLTIESPRIYTSMGVPISVTGIAQVC